MMERWHKKVRNFLNNGRNQTTGEVVYGRYLQDLPSHKIAEIEKSAQSAFCAPHKCLEEVHSSVKKRLNKNTEEPQEPIFENVFDWSQGKEYADGLVTSLYERSTKDGQKKYMGDPIADSLAVVTRRNSAILALADGVSWGQKSRLAATCGIYGSVKYLNDNLANCKTTKDVFNQILKGFEQAQNCIVSEQGTMTTLCVAVVVPMPEKERYGLCAVNVGDSYAYVFNKHYGVKEVTEGSHPINEVRDMRNSGGALGPADGYNPDLSNLTCSFIIIEKGDLVFLCSDGISDNFDPVIAKHSPPRMEVKSLPSSFEASTELSKKEFRKQKTESFEELDNAPDIHVESVREESICASCLKKSAETPVDTNEKQNSLDFLPKVNVDELIAMKNKRNSPEHFQDVMNTDDNAKRKSPEIFTDPLRKTSPAISDLFPAYDKTKPNKPNLQKTDSIKIPVCQKCGKALRRITEWALPYLGDRRSSVLDCLPKLSESTSMDRISEEKKTSAEETRGKSRSFTNSNDAPSPTVELDKEAKIAKLHNASSMGRLTSQSSLDEITGQKTKETPANELTPAERRDGALQHMTQIISKKLEMDEGTSQNIIVGEVCAQVINYVIGNTNEKRTILERVPQSELNQMSSQDRRLHREKIKKELEGVPGKLDHASIVCYEVGYHDDSKEIISLDPTKSTVAEPKELKNVKKSFFRSFSAGSSLPAPKTDSSVDETRRIARRAAMVYF